MDIKTAIRKIIARESLSEKEMRSVFGAIMSGRATPAQIGAFITVLRMKGETVDEIAGAVRVMREKALKVKAGGTVLDTCGTGGSGIDTFNISTAAAFVVAACGVKVAKHGNRAASSRSGSADVLEALGVKIDIPPALVEKCIKEIGVGFMFAPVFHGAMKHASGPRRDVGVRTIFNMIGPLSNPASASCQVMGVYEPALTEVMANVLKKLGTKRAYVVHGGDGLDEATLTGYTRISELRNGRVRTFRVSPQDFGLKKASIRTLLGGGAEKNAVIIKDILSGKKGPRRDIVLMNAALGLMAAGKASGFKQGVRTAAGAVDSGMAMEKLGLLVKMTNGRKRRAK